MILLYHRPIFAYRQCDVALSVKTYRPYNKFLLRSALIDQLTTVRRGKTEEFFNVIILSTFKSLNGPYRDIVKWAFCHICKRKLCLEAFPMGDAGILGCRGRAVSEWAWFLRKILKRGSLQICHMTGYNNSGINSPSLSATWWFAMRRPMTSRCVDISYVINVIIKVQQ